MRDINPHQTYKIHRLHIIIVPFLIVLVICSGSITDTPLKPMRIVLPLNLHYERGTILTCAHKIIAKLFASQCGTLILCRKTLNMSYLAVHRQQGIQDRHYHIIVSPISEHCLKSGIAQQIHIPFLRLLRIVIFSEFFIHMRLYFKITPAKFRRAIRILKKYTAICENWPPTHVRGQFLPRNLLDFYEK